jgi:hypothetical protein
VGGQLDPESLQDSLQVDQELDRLEPQQPIPSPLRAGCSTGILLMALEVKLPINLNDELGLGAIEVDHVGVHSPLRP